VYLAKARLRGCLKSINCAGNGFTHSQEGERELALLVPQKRGLENEDKKTRLLRHPLKSIACVGYQGGVSAEV